MAKYIVFGAGGSIGSAVTREALRQGHSVIAGVRDMSSPLSQSLSGDGAKVWPVFNVTYEEVVNEYADRANREGGLDGLVYCVGHCPPRGFSRETGTPLSEMRTTDYMREVQMHQIGVLQVFKSFLYVLKQGGSMVFLSSAINRFAGRFPPGMYPYHHCSVIAAEDSLILGMRHDPVVMKRGVRVHRIAPAAVDTPFHEGSPAPKLIPVQDVVTKVMLALATSDHSVDWELT